MIYDKLYIIEYIRHFLTFLKEEILDLFLSFNFYPYRKLNSIKNKFVYLFRNILYRNWKVVLDGVTGGTNAMKAVIYPAVRYDCSLITSNSDS